MDAHSIVLQLRDKVEDFLTTGSSTPERHLSLVFGAVASFMIFVQANWTGPTLPDTLSLAPVRPMLDDSLPSACSTTPCTLFPEVYKDQLHYRLRLPCYLNSTSSRWLY